MAFGFDPKYTRRALQLERPWLSDQEIDLTIVAAEAWHWVEEHNGEWNHEDWLCLVKRVQYLNWRIEPEDLGRLLEALKQKYHSR